MDKFEIKQIASQLGDSGEAHPAIVIGESTLLQLQPYMACATDA